MVKKPRLSIVIPCRQTKMEHRDVKRLDDCLQSLDNQTVAGQFEVIVSDTDSDTYYKAKHAAICKAHGAKYLYLKTGSKIWNISRARNAGIRAARGVFVAVTDFDCVFSPDFLETTFKHLDEGNILHCRIYDLPEKYEGTLNDWERMKALSALRPNWCYGGSQAVSRAWAESVHGYDEKFELWGADDTDFMERAVAAGKKNVWIENETSYFHQYHSKANRAENPEQLARNKARLKLTETRQLPIIRNPHEWGGKPDPDEWDDTAVIVTTFLRDKSLLRMIQSIRKYYPIIDIIVADNGHSSPEKTQWAIDLDFKLIEVPFDSGVTAARNVAMFALEPRHKYIVIAEDDIGFMPETDFKKWRDVLDDDSQIGVVGGHLIQNSDVYSLSDQNYEAELEIKDDTAYIRRIENPKWKAAGRTKYHLADIVLNVFMMRREVWDTAKWDENIKSAPEHDDWFMTLKYKTPWKVAYAPEVVLYHFKDAQFEYDENYRAYRARPGAFAYYADKWKVEWLWSSWNLRFGFDNPCRLRTYAEANTKSRRLIFANVAKILNELDLKWWLEAGTCLGAIREQDFIGHDPDIDIGVWHDDPKVIAEIISVQFKSAGFELKDAREHDGRAIQLSFLAAGTKIDIFFFYERNGLAWHGAFGPVNADGTGGYSVFLPHIFSLSLFKDLKEINFVGLKVKTPNPVDRYLTERYGPNWKTPDKDYKYWLHCRAVARKFFTPDDATVYIGGVWDVFHHGHLNILERCRALGQRLIVGVLTDDAAEAYKARPLIPEEERLRIIKSLRIVDDAILQHHQDPTADLTTLGLKPDYIVHGDDWTECPGADYVQENGGKVVLVPYTQGISSTIIKLGGEMRKIKPLAKTTGPEYAVGIKTFMRERTLFKTIAAFEKNLTEPFRFYIADDSSKKSDRKLALYQDLRARGHIVIEMQNDSGLSAGRNAIVKAAVEPFILITDDDVAIGNDETVKRLRAVLDSRADIGLCAAMVKQEKSGAPFASDNYIRGLRFERIGKLLKRIPAPTHYEKAAFDGGDTLYVMADQVPNCFLAHREIFDDLRWDERIRIEWEHIAFFIRMKEAGRWKAAVAVEADATHFLSEPDLEYERHRRNAPMAYFKQAYGIEMVVNQF